VAEGDVPDTDPTLVERWLQDQQQWQRTLFTYLDSMMKNDEFLVHMGNAMRGSLLAGKPYPTAAPPQAPADDPATADRLDKVLFALHQLQGQMKDVLMTLDEMRASRAVAGAAAKASARKRPSLPTVASAKVGARKKASAKRATSGSARKTGKRRTRS
jgi:hypothetical protein